MPQIVSSVVHVIERDASASIKMKRVVCMLYVLGASHYVQRTWNKLSQRAVSGHENGRRVCHDAGCALMEADL